LKTKILIKKCSQKKSWYKNNVGEIFVVYAEKGGEYYVRDGKILKPILKIDVEILEVE
jgi:hypothetical protein